MGVKHVESGSAGAEQLSCAGMVESTGLAETPLSRDLLGNRRGCGTRDGEMSKFCKVLRV